ncbi:MAG TPA: peptidyl-prolyl cis-trans isomerase [Polyangiaceae bacterium]
MNRWASIVLGAGVLVLCVVLVFFAAPVKKSVQSTTTPIAQDSAAVPTTTTAVALDGGLGLEGLTLDPPIHTEPVTGTGPGFSLIDGAPVPPLPPSAPRQATFGVVMVTYAGAEMAPKTARPKAEALELAKKLAVDAKTDFKGAVQRGDNGSTDNDGTIERGILEPAPEYALFSLPVGGVSDVVDTPRGFWIVRRIE